MSLSSRIIVIDSDFIQSATSISDALAQRYLAGVLELSSFWRQSGEMHITVFTKILDRVIRLLNDLGLDGDDEEDTTGIFFDHEGIDSMASAILIGVLDWHVADSKSQYWYRSLSEIVRSLRRHVFPFPCSKFAT
jgi:hypothetical protein